MSFVEVLKGSLKENVVTTHLFLLKYDPNKNIIHAFFEGKTDGSFYCTSIRKYKPESWDLKTYICGNNDSVYYHFKKLSSKHLKHQPLLFFVDKDIEDIIPFSRPKSKVIYTTEYYSIENYIVTGEAIEQIWSEIFRQPSGSAESKELVKTFINAQQKIHIILLDIMSWILLHRREGNSPNLDCIQTKDYFKIDDQLKVERLLNLEETIDLLDKQTKTKTSEEEIKKIEEYKEELKTYHAKEVIRGHNEMDFFITFIKKLSDVVLETSEKKIKARVDITKANVVDIMGPRVKIPKTLEEFLRYHLESKNLNLQN